MPKHVGGFVRRLGQFSPHRRSHQHAELEFNLVVQGCGTYIVEARRYELTPRSLLWLFPRQEHVLIDFTADFVMWVVVFRTSLVRNLCLSDSTRVLRRMNPPGDFCRTLSAAFAEKLIRLLSLIAEESTPAVFNAGIGHLLLKTWETFEQSRNAEPARTLHPAVDKTVRLLRQNDPPDSVADLAREVSASPTYLSRLFLQQVGLSISEFRNRERIRRFLALADESSDETMLRLALRAGFGSYAQFHRVFRQCMNLSPAQWARNHRNAPFPNP
ncbi:MAG: helix-turn-helix transcriptional regulator [Phycisphaerae bacterium]|nr:helix-turn-helix transcriptional regulator [Phycisphaerae bacterium]